MKKYKQFLTKEGRFIPTSDVAAVDKIEQGVYELSTNITGEGFFIPKEINTDKYLSLPDSVGEQVVTDIESFWKPETKLKYEEFGVTYKRGILLYGQPGTGKTCTVLKVIQNVVEKGGIAIYNPNPNLFSSMIAKLRQIQGDCPVVCVFEEFDNYCGKADFLSLLDGELQVPNVVYIATTNYIDKIPDNLKKRPSRFATVIEIGKPTAEARSVYIRSKLPNISLESLTKWVDLTDGMIIDQIKNVIISVHCFNQDFKESLEITKNLGVKEFGIRHKVNDDEDKD